MKELLLIRHAKSSWANTAQSDFDRPLNDRGRKDAPMMAKKLLEKPVSIDHFISSTAVRALGTAQYFAAVYGVPATAIELVPELYHAPPPVFYEVIRRLPDNIHTVALFSHNPGITSFVNELTNVQIDDMPTCCIFALKVHSNHWHDFASAKKDCWFVDYPKAGH